MNIVITGTSRGIGLELVRQYAEGGERIFALCRAPEKASALQLLANNSGGRVTVHDFEAADPGSAARAARDIGDVPIDILINNAGILGPTHERQLFTDMDFDGWMTTFEVNTIGPFRVVQAFVAKLAKSGRGKIVTMTSQVGASPWPNGGLYAYASAKAASNRVVQILAIDLKPMNITVNAMHPGYVKTDMSGPGGEITVEESASGVRKVIASIGPADTGKFFRWNGDINPW